MSVNPHVSNELEGHFRFKTREIVHRIAVVERFFSTEGFRQSWPFSVDP